MLKNGIDLPGVKNARELGGFPVGGKLVKKGILLRTGTFAHAADEAKNNLSGKYRVQTIIDFRMTDERAKTPDPVIPGAKNVSLAVIEMEDYLAALDKGEKAGRFLSMSRESIVELAYERGLIGPNTYSSYLLSERGRKAYREFFRILLDADPEKGAILWHCTDGKDRTGLASALLLSALGASKETVFEDYLLTNEYNAAVIQKAREKYAHAGLSEEKMDVMLFVSGGAIERYLSNAFDALDTHFGGVEGYCAGALGLGREETEMLRMKYTC